MKTVIITGGIGTGKSYVSQYLAEKLNAPMMNYDTAWHNFLKTNESLRREIIQRFGRIVATTFDGTEIDRKVLAQIVFSSKEIMSDYMALIAPYLREMEKPYTESSAWRNTIAEIPVGHNCVPMDCFLKKDVLFVGVFASRATQIRRIVTRSKWKVSAQEAERRIDFQPDPSSYMHRCDICFFNEDKSPIDELVDIVKTKRRR